MTTVDPVEAAAEPACADTVAASVPLVPSPSLLLHAAVVTTANVAISTAIPALMNQGRARRRYRRRSAGRASVAITSA
jgi:hypothetical protein